MTYSTYVVFATQAPRGAIRQSRTSRLSNTNVASFDALLEASGFKVESQADFEAIPDAEWEKVIRSQTSFSSWRQMQEKAGEEYAKKKLMEGV